MTLPSATQFPAISFKRGVTDKVYKTISALLWDIVEIMKAELARLSAEGVSYIQIDAPRYSYYMDPKWREWIRTEMNVEPDALFEESIRADNACFAGCAAAGRHAGDAPLPRQQSQPLVRRRRIRRHRRKAVRHARAWTAFCSNTMTRAPERLSRCGLCREGRAVVLGLISSKLPQMEDPATLARRIDEAARYVPLENLALSPQCGFASMMEGNLLTEEQQWAKLQLVVDTARKVWK